MYNLAKLLTDEPAKLERLIILFLKLVITFSVTIMCMGYDFSVQTFIDKPVPEKFSSVQLVYFFIAMVVVWFFVWTIICEIILCEVLVRLICWKIPKKEAFNAILDIIGGISKNSHYAIIVDILKELEDDDNKADIEEGHTRINTYYGLSVVIFVLFLVSKDVHLMWWQIVIGVLVLINFIVASIIIRLVKSYVMENREVVIRQLEPMAYSQKTLETIEGMEFFNSNYETPKGQRTILMKRKTDDANYPEEITIDTAFHWNQDLGQIALVQALKEWNERYKANNILKNTVLMTNIEPNEKIKKLMRPLHGLIYIHAVTEKEIFHRLELAMFKLELQQREKVMTLNPPSKAQ